MITDKDLQVFPQCPKPFQWRLAMSTDEFLSGFALLVARRRRARRQQRWAIALCMIGAVLLVAWEVW